VSELYEESIITSGGEVGRVVFSLLPNWFFHFTARRRNEKANTYCHMIALSPALPSRSAYFYVFAYQIKSNNFISTKFKKTVIKTKDFLSISNKLWDRLWKNVYTNKWLIVTSLCVNWTTSSFKRRMSHSYISRSSLWTRPFSSSFFVDRNLIVKQIVYWPWIHTNFVIILFSNLTNDYISQFSRISKL